LRLCLSEHQLAMGAGLFDQYFGREVYYLKSLFHDERQRIITQIVDSTLSDMDKLYGEVYEYNTGLIDFLRELSMPLPAILRVSSEFVLHRSIRRLLTREEIDFKGLSDLLERARAQNIALDASIKCDFSKRLDQLIERWSTDPYRLETISQLESLISLMCSAPLKADLWKAQNMYYVLMVQISSRKASPVNPDWLSRFLRLGECLEMATAPWSSATSDDPSDEATNGLSGVETALPPFIESVCTVVT
jgi:hypothetical protein